jgi:Na+/H+-dicarboxylate symporter
MNPKHRRFILTSLIVALVLGWGMGWIWGENMSSGIASSKLLTTASREYRDLSYALHPDAIGKIVSQTRTELGSAIKSGARPGEILEIKARLRVAELELATAPDKIEEFRLRLAEAKTTFSGYSGWYTIYRLSSFSGKLFLNLLNLLVIPLVVASLIMGIVSLGDIRHVGRTGLRTLVYYFVTTAISVAIGIALVQIIRPGAGLEGAVGIAESLHGKENVGMLDTILTVFINEENPAKGAFPNNIFSAMAQMNILGVIVFTLFFGAALTMIGEKARPVIKLFSGINETILKMIHWVLYLLPVGVFGLVVTRLAETGGGPAVSAELSRIGYYTITVVAGLAIHAVVVLPLILWLLTKRDPLKYASGMTQALFTAFSTASSSATLPSTMECAEVNNNVSPRAASFVLPIGATINMDGTALYEAVAVIFIAQVYNIPMTATVLMVIFLTATLAAIGAAGIPEAGLVTMVIVLNATGLPIEGITMLLSIDWFLDRCRTTVNVWGDAVGAAVVDSFEEKAAP